MKILVPIDGSTPSIKALDYAIYLLKLMNPNADDARNKHSEVILITILPHFPVPLGFEKPISPSRLIKLFLCLNSSKK